MNPENSKTFHPHISLFSFTHKVGLQRGEDSVAL